VVQFFTTLGRIQEQGKTNDGVARVNLTSDSRSGNATVTAISGAAEVDSPLTIEVGAVLPERVIVIASPPRIVLSVSRTTHVFATVLDASGNPVANVPVIFRVAAANASTEFMESGGRPIFTDTNGRAEDVVRTQRPVGSPPGTITVEAVVLSGTPITTGNTVVIPVQ
jgi:adhesin/invasin